MIPDATNSPTSLPLVSLAIPTYNRPELLERALQCAIAQHYPALEILVSDNASPGDATADLLERYRLRDSRIRVWRHARNGGVLWNLLFLLEQARGEYFMWLADDDSITANYVDALARRLRADPDTACAFSRYRHIAPDGTNTVRRRGFESASPWARAMRYLMQPDDGFYYGVHRTAVLRGIPYRGWWPPNRGIATNWAYPYLFEVILTGKVSIVDDASVEWINDERAAKNYSVAGSLYGIFQFVMLRLNVHVEYVRRAFARRGLAMATWMVLLGAVALSRDYFLFGAQQVVQISSRIFRRRNQR
jgi:glycosyltransferase involved in cell wall biosynthesis